MGLIGMPIGPVKTIKRVEKCLTTSSLLLTQTQGSEGREWRRPKEEYQRQTERDEMEWYTGRKGSGEKAQSLDPSKAGLEGGAEKGRERGTGMEIKNSKKEEYDAVGWQSWRTTEEKRKSWRMWVEGHSQISNPHFLHKYSRLCCKKKHVTDLRVTNKVTVCDQTHKSNTLPLEMALFGSSKASKPAAPYGQRQYSVALILTRQPINWQQNHKQPTVEHFQINDIKKKTFSPCWSVQS